MTTDTPNGLLHGKRVLFVFCSPELGGAERQGIHLAKHLKNQGCDVRVWSNLPGPGKVADLCREAGLAWEFHPFRWPCRKSSLMRDGWQLLLALKRERPDVILPYTTWPNVGCGLMWRMSPAKVCIWGQRNVHGLRGDAIERWAFRQASAVICNATHEINYLQTTLGATRAPVHVVRNGVELGPCQKTRSEWRAELGLDEAAVAVTMVANFRSVKDHAVLLQAWQQLLTCLPESISRPCLLLAGAPQDSYVSVYRLAGELGLRDHIKFLGQVSDISGLLAASDIGVLVSDHEGMSNAVIEYMAGGLPVVATDLPGNREALGDDLQQSFCRAGDVDSLVVALQKLVLDPSLRQALGARNRRRAAVEFSLEAMCTRTSEIIGDVLAGSPRLRRSGT